MGRGPSIRSGGLSSFGPGCIFTLVDIHPKCPHTLLPLSFRVRYSAFQSLHSPFHEGPVADWRLRLCIRRTFAFSSEIFDQVSTFGPDPLTGRTLSHRIVVMINHGHTATRTTKETTFAAAAAFAAKYSGD